MQRRSRARRARLVVTAVFALAPLVAACDEEPPARTRPPPEELGRCADFDPLRNPYFGDTHVHTTYSLDANLQATRLGPADAYRFARGEEVGIQPYREDGEAMRRLRLARPLDFVVVADHAEFLGTVTACSTPGHPGYDHPSCSAFREDPVAAFVSLNSLTARPQDEVAYPEACGPGGADCLDEQLAVWLEIQDAAEEAYDRSDACSFTSFVGYEWSANPGTLNLHRNVLFRNDVVPELPISYFDEPYPEGLWRALRERCIDAGTGCDALTIPHNGNLSGGLMFAEVTSEGEPFTPEYAAERESMEPLIEVFQHKGSSECLADTNTGDELCSFEAAPYVSLSGPPLGIRGRPVEQSFVRYGLGRGLLLEADLGANPFHYGLIASTDTHIAAPGAVSEVGFPGHGGAGGDNSEELPPGLPDVVEFNPGGLAVLWAEENSREALFMAMERREAYGTSGPRIVLRFFGGWSYPDDLCEARDFAARGYEGGVPMGGTLPARPAGAEAPVFAIWALRDPGAGEEPGTPLQRIQVIKGWRSGEDVEVLVYDVGGDPDNGATVDLATCEPEGAGFDSLCEVWTDPEFDPGQHAFYYVRVLENPTCRWATMQCNAHGVDCADPTTVTDGLEGCCLDTWERAVQERAWSSPIWYVPAAGG